MCGIRVAWLEYPATVYPSSCGGVFLLAGRQHPSCKTIRTYPPYCLQYVGNTFLTKDAGRQAEMGSAIYDCCLACGLPVRRRLDDKTLDLTAAGTLPDAWGDLTALTHL
jgi:hypothetical protein